jgi:hypothetical protein
MSDFGTAAAGAVKTVTNPPPNPAAVAGANAASKLFSELKVSAHLMTFDAGLYCIVQTPSTRRPDDGTGLPGVRISLPPAPVGRPDAVSFASFRPDGWLSGASDALLVRVASGPSQVLVTIYQAPIGAETAPRLQVLRLSEDPGVNAGAPAAGGMPAGMQPAPQPGPMPDGIIPEVVAHAQIRGDIGAALGDWIGDKGSKRWIEGFMLTPRGTVAAADIEYQAVLGRGWLSPWVEGGQLCGSRGMALPVLGLRIRLRGATASTHRLQYSATFVDGTAIGPVDAGEPCEADSLAPLEAFQVVITPNSGAKAASAKEPAAKATQAVAPAKPVRSIRGKAPVTPKKK